MNDTYQDGICAGVLLAIIICVASYHIFPNNIVKQGVDAIKQCESALPRGQRCTIVAVPE